MSLTVAQQKTILASNIMVNIVSDVLLNHAVVPGTSTQLKYTDVRVKTTYIMVTEGTINDKYTFIDASPAANPIFCYGFKLPGSYESYTLDGTQANHTTITAEDIIAFIYTLKTGTYGTTYVLVTLAP